MLRLSVIIFRNAQGKILLQFRDSEAPSTPLGWSFFGGVAKGNESSLDALIREVKEELGMNLHPDGVQLLIEKQWTSPRTGKEKTVYLYACVFPNACLHRRIRRPRFQVP